MAWGDEQAYPQQNANPEALIAVTKTTIGASGAVSSTTGAPGVVIANTGTGTYSVTHPKAPAVAMAWSLQSAAGTVKQLWFTASDNAAGTAAFTTGNGGGTATNPANGDIIMIIFYVLRAGVI